MSADDAAESAADAGGRERESGLLGLLRVAAVIAIVAGAAGSVGLMLRAGQRTPRFLLVLFTIWVLSPFVAVAWATIVSKGWSVVTRATLHAATVIVALGTLAIYSDVVPLRPSGSANAFPFVIVPPASWAFLTITISIAAFVSRRPSRRRGDV